MLPESVRVPGIRTPDQRLRVFISSTIRELAAERAAAVDAVTSLRLTPVVFEAGARPHPPRELYRAYVEQSNIFVGIYYREYGWVTPDTGVSGIEDEYMLAEDKPRLVYVKNAPDRDERLETMLARIKDDGDVSYKRFSTAEELRELIANDLALLLTERFERSEAGSEEAAASSLPAIAARLIGRSRELAELRELLQREDARLVTLTGPGGTGKTRLAIEAARHLDARFPDGVHFVSLSPVREPSLVAPAIAEVLNIHEASARPVLEIIKDVLRDKRLLLLLDNFEQVLDAAMHVSELLSAAPGLKVLATSREPLQLYAEHEFPVPPLPVPHEGPGQADILENPSVQLFMERATAVKPDLGRDPETLRTAAEICARLDGLPLAIELAAAWVRFASPASVLDRLANRLDLLSRGPRDLPERQRTMRAAIAWSYDLLSEAEQALFTRLSVFAGSCSLDAVEAIANPGGELGIDTLEGLTSLCTKSMLRSVEGGSARGRFEMLDLMRAFAAERLVASGELATIRDRHCRYFCDFAAENRERLIGADADVLRAHHDDDYPNWRQALLWGIDCMGAGRELPGPLDALLDYLSYYWYLAGRLGEGRDLSGQALEVARPGGVGRVYASALAAAGATAIWQSDIAQARRNHEESVAMWRRLGDPEGLRHALMLLGLSAVNQGDARYARRVLEECLELMGEEVPAARFGIVLMHLGNAALDLGEYDVAQAHFERGLENQRRLGSPWGVASLLNNLGEAARCRGDYEAAGRYYAESLELFETVQSPGDVARERHSLAYVALRSGDLEWARGLFLDALAEYRRQGHRRGIAECIQGLASVAAARGSFRQAARLAGAAGHIFGELAAEPWPADRIERDRDMQLIEAALGPETAERGLREGRAMLDEDAIALAMEA